VGVGIILPAAAVASLAWVFGTTRVAGHFNFSDQTTTRRAQVDKSIEKSINVRVPVHTAYNQWTQFEEFPQFMEGIQEVRQLDDTHVHWVAEIGGKHKEWDAEITEQLPDERIAWRSVGGAGNSGVVQFRPLGENETEIRVRMEYEPEGAVEKLGTALGAPDQRVQGDLERFKEFIESRGQESGAWRGEVHGGERTD
jgi:uncharacterized membrane protein